MLSIFATFTVNIASSTKRLRLNEKFSILWHKCLSYISRQRIERLIKDEILQDIDFLDFDTYVECIKGKLTVKIRNVKIDRCTELFGTIHTYVCGHLRLDIHSILLVDFTKVINRNLNQRIKISFDEID